MRTILALQFHKSIPRYLLLRALRSRLSPSKIVRLAPVSLRRLPEARLPTPQWVRLAPRLAGVCGSDLATVGAKGSPYLAPVTSMPFVLGHEVVADVIEVGGDAGDITAGARVALHPALGCRVRGIHPPCRRCADGFDALCRNVAHGDIAAGIQTGYCRDTGGAFAESLVAHRSQVYRVPDELDDRTAVLVEPFSCALHAVLRADVKDDYTVLVIGGGTIGLLTIAALRATGCRARIVAACKYDHQRQHARRLGADELVDAGGAVAARYDSWARAVGAEVLAPELGKPTVLGGVDVTFDCVASAQSIDDGVRFTDGGGTFVLVGMPGIPKGVDWTPLWQKEITIRASYAYGPEARYARDDGGATPDTFDVAIDLMRRCGQAISTLVGEPFALADFRAALACAMDTRRSGVVKTVFAIQQL